MLCSVEVHGADTHKGMCIEQLEKFATFYVGQYPELRLTVQEH
jgi:hypothetical protein